MDIFIEMTRGEPYGVLLGKKILAASNIVTSLNWLCELNRKIFFKCIHISVIQGGRHRKVGDHSNVLSPSFPLTRISNELFREITNEFTFHNHISQLIHSINFPRSQSLTCIANVFTATRL